MLADAGRASAGVAVGALCTALSKTVGLHTMGSDSWLSKNIRPMSLIAIFFGYFLFAMMSAFKLDANEVYVTLLGQWGMLVMSFYFGGRTLEKIMDMKAKK